MIFNCPHDLFGMSCFLLGFDWKGFALGHNSYFHLSSLYFKSKTSKNFPSLHQRYKMVWLHPVYNSVQQIFNGRTSWILKKDSPSPSLTYPSWRSKLLMSSLNIIHFPFFSLHIFWLSFLILSITPPLRQLEVIGLKEEGPVVEKEAVLRLTTFLIDKVTFPHWSRTMSYFSTAVMLTLSYFVDLFSLPGRGPHKLQVPGWF